MMMNRHLALSATALAAAVLVVGVSVLGSAPPQPLSPAAAVSPAMEAASPALSGMSSGSMVDERKTDGTLSATGMEHVPVFD